MKIIYPFVFFAFITLQVFGQRPGDANYNPLKAKLRTPDLVQQK